MRKPFAAPLPGLAPRAVRLIAVLIDGLVTLPVVLVWSVAAGGSIGLSLGLFAKVAGAKPWLDRVGTVFAGTVAWVVFAAASLALIWLTLYQWWLLSTRGQTIGKRLLGIRIVELDGQPAGFVSALLLRTFVFMGLTSVVAGLTSALIPFAAVVLWALDYLPAFGEDRRCLHDYLAGTQVRWARVGDPFVGRTVGAVFGVAVVGALVAAVIEREALLQWMKPPPPPVVSTAVTAVPAPQAPTEVVKPSAPPKVVEVPSEPPMTKEKSLYQFTDDQGVVHVTDDLDSVPARFRAKVTRL